MDEVENEDEALMPFDFMNYTLLPSPKRVTEHHWPEDTKPVVSICCITYNHKDYIAEAIEGFLMQETTFPVEILINDDASTDGTADILRSYQARYPKLIHLVLQTENQYSKGNSILIKLLTMATGKYIALCEGDDFWICKQKLQKQVAFMEVNKNVTICFHDAYSEIYDAKNVMTERKSFTYQPPLRPTLQFDDFAGGFAPHTAACLIINRRDIFVRMAEQRLRFIKTVFNALLEQGEVAAFLPEKMSVYRIHQGGIYSSVGFERQLILANSSLWGNRKFFSSRHHIRIFTLKLIGNYIALLRLQLLDRRIGQAFSSSVIIMQLVTMPPSLRVIRIFAGRLFAFVGKKMGFKR